MLDLQDILPTAFNHPGRPRARYIFRYEISRLFTNAKPINGALKQPFI
jgi:hypothetical protein